jgi:cytochrome oxidase assembly protein ShyY1
MALAAATMVGLGLWQLDRYHHRTAINDRIDAASANPPVALEDVLTPPRAPTPGAVGPPPAAESGWTRVTVAGRYDQSREVLARARTVEHRVGFEVVTPLVLDDGTAVLVNRGWLPPAGAGAATPPQVPAAPAGEVTVIGRVHAPESRAGAPEPFGGVLAVRRIDPARLAPSLPYALYGAYLTVESQTPPADPIFVGTGPTYENAGMNAGYVVQWWLFAALTLAGYVYLAVREGRTSARGPAGQPHAGDGTLDLIDAPIHPAR